MKDIFPAPRPSTVKISTMQDVQDWITENGPQYLNAALIRLVGNAHGEPLSRLPADLNWIEANFPKARKGIHPRPDLNQKLEPYKKWRADLIRAVNFATGVTEKKKELRARQDGWALLHDAVKLHGTENGGIIAKNVASPLPKLSDTARMAGIEPWELGEPETLQRIEAAITVPGDRSTVSRALKFLKSYAVLPEVAELLPKTGVPVLPTLRQKAALPEALDTLLIDMAHKAACQRDEVAGSDSQAVSDSTVEGYLAALRHHVRILPSCPAESALGYKSPVSDLEAVNDFEGLFSFDHIAATIRRTEAVEHLNDTLTERSAYSYYSRLLVALGRNGLLEDKTVTRVKTSKFLQRGKQAAQGMSRKNKAWCKSLARNPERERRFRNLHRLIMQKAKEVLANADGRELTDAELTQVRQLGTCAAASAIEYSGRPIRLANVLGLRIAGSRQNFFTPGQHRTAYEFMLFADETKSGKDEEETELQQKLHGPLVLSWYLREIRPLFPHAKNSIYLFPAVKSSAALDTGTFDTWFQRAASLVELPMNFHKWRHGYATLLIKNNPNAMQAAADLLGNTLPVCARNYAWLDKKKNISDGQKMVVNGHGGAA